MAEMKYAKETDYGNNKNDYIAPDEITVTITLAEYRDLVSVKATTDKLVKDAEKDKYARDTENRTLKEENARLKAELYELQKRLDVEVDSNDSEKSDS